MLKVICILATTTSLAALTWGHMPAHAQGVAASLRGGAPISPVQNISLVQTPSAWYSFVTPSTRYSGAAPAVQTPATWYSQTLPTDWYSAS